MIDGLTVQTGLAGCLQAWKRATASKTYFLWFMGREIPLRAFLFHDDGGRKEMKEIWILGLVVRRAF